MVKLASFLAAAAAGLTASIPARALEVGTGEIELEDPSDQACVAAKASGNWQSAGHQCLIKAPPPPADGWVGHYKWCLGQTRTPVDPSGQYAERLTYIYQRRDPSGSVVSDAPEKDTWTLRHDADCNDPAVRALAGIGEIPQEQEMCVALQSGLAMDVVALKAYQQPGSHHMIVWNVQSPCNREDGANCAAAGVFPSSGVNDWRSFVCDQILSIFDLNVVAGSQTVEYAVPFPDDDDGTPGHVPLVGLSFGQNHYFLFNHHIQRYDWDPTKSIAGEAWIAYYDAAVTPRNKAHFFLEGLTGDATILIPPYTLGHPQGAWYPPKWPAWVFGLTAHMHKRGLVFMTNKTPANPIAGTAHRNPNCDNAQNKVKALYYTTSWSEPDNCFYSAAPGEPGGPIRFDAGEGLRYECLTNNGVKNLPQELTDLVAPDFPRDVKWACEEVPGVPPNIPFFFLGGRLPVPCTPEDPEHFPFGALTTDPDCVGKQGQLSPWPLTGRCVPANLVFGPSQDDEMCLLPGMYWMDENGAGSGFPEASSPGGTR